MSVSDTVARTVATSLLTILEILVLVLSPGVELLALSLCIPREGLKVERNALLDGDNLLNRGSRSEAPEVNTSTTNT